MLAARAAAAALRDAALAESRSHRPRPLLAPSARP